MSRWWLAFTLVVSACAAPPDGARDFPVSGEGPGGKEDVFGRKLAGIAAPYDADVAIDGEVLRRDARKRRLAAWATARKVLEEVPLLGLAGSAAEHPEIMLPGGGEVPRVPRFETWYGVDDLKRTFQHLYAGLGANGRAAHVAFEEAALGDGLSWNATALDRSDRWPLERYFDYVNRLGCPAGTTPDECARLLQGNLAGATAGTSRILYSPATARHLLASYRQVVDCLAQLDAAAVDAPPADDANFTLCFERELPRDAALVKAQWVRADLGKGFPAFDTDGASLARRLGGTADWGDEGDRRTDPSADEIYTIRLRDGSIFRLAGLHIMTKEARHWQWLTLWWSDRPDDDFGADRPAALRERGAWRNYKMCAVSWYVEGDGDPAGRFADAPSLADALRATGAAAGKPTWCSNPYVEHGRGNARTNCIGCHQHGGATMAFGMPLEPERIIADETRFPSTGRAQLRQLFPADYLYSFNRVDDWSRLFQSEMSYFERADLDAARPRIRAIQALTGVASSGGERFAASCARCHGDDGGGTDRAPNLHDRVPLRDDESLLRTLIQGKGGMPRWGERLGDQDLADVLAFLRQEFGQPEL
jgi:mono/diheme cytochrome c family protein